MEANERISTGLTGKVYRYPFWPADFAARAIGPLFKCQDGTPVFHGDEFWCFADDSRSSANQKNANAKFDYNDGQPRFATKEQAQEAIKVYQWLNDGCHAGRDGDCIWSRCPQLAAGEPEASGRSCPRYKDDEDW